MMSFQLSKQTSYNKGVGVGTQGGLITLSAVDDCSRQGSNPWAPTSKEERQ